MKRVSLITSRNVLYRGTLAEEGFSVTEHSFPVTPPVLAEILNDGLCDATIAEASPAGINDCPDLYRAIGARERVICCADSLSPEDRHFLLSCGIADVIEGRDDERLMRAIQAPVGGQGAGSFLVLEHGNAVRKVLRSILGRFNYRVMFIDSVDELFAQPLDGSVQFVLVNIGAAGLDLNGLVRKSYSRELAKSVPVIAYKDMREGLFVHELVGGLNRLTKYILSLEELYGLLVEVLYRRELIPLVAELRRLADYEANTCYDSASLSRAFFECERTIFSQSSLLTDAVFDATGEAGRRLRDAVRKVESLKWLRFEIDRKSINTAGREG